MTAIAAIADQFFEAIKNGDVAVLEGLYSPDVSVWHNYDELNQNRDESMRTLAWLNKKAGPLRYVDIRRVLLDDGFIQQHVVELGGIAEGLRMPAMLRVYCDEHLIHRIEEYVDPGPLNAKLAAR